MIPTSNEMLDRIDAATEKFHALNDPLAVPSDAAPIGRTTQLHCPCCGESDANISLDLWRLGDDNDGAFTCQECNVEFSIADVRNFIAKWSKFLNWLDSVPKLD